MIIDNKRDRYPSDGLDIRTVWDFISEFAGIGSHQQGKLDIVTGYFTIRALAQLHDGLPAADAFRIISSEMLRRDDERAPHVIDLLSGDLGMERVLGLTYAARKAKAFLERDTVDMRAILQAFCHAKMYQFTNRDGHHSSFHLTGSSNLTDAGLGLVPSANVELNIGSTCMRSDNDFRELQGWFQDTWEAAAREIVIEEGGQKRRIPIKQHFIRLIEDFFREYTPEQLYYKILFELFSADLELDASLEHRQDMTLLQDSAIWQTLFEYQRKGVVSLIKMLRLHGGAILADAVGLGKTFSALAVIKYFTTQGYATLLLCPKKLQENWEQYLRKHGSRFERDDFDYTVRFHTDLQDNRLNEHYSEAQLPWLQSRPKLLIVIDESHNLRNEKSSRYKELLDSLVRRDPNHPARDVKVLMLSATPLNTGLRDIRGQFNLIARGEDDAFSGDDFKVLSLANTFSQCQRKYKEWVTAAARPTVRQLIALLPPEFFGLTDRLIVARTRSLIEKTLGEDLGFPRKAKPLNIYQGVEHFGKFHDTAAIHAAFDTLQLTAYQPSLFMAPSKQKAKAREEGEGAWGSDINRERFLVRMMAVLFMKRLESSWHSCLLTVEKVLSVHTATLDKALAFRDHQPSPQSGGVGGGLDTLDIDPERDLREMLDDDEEFTLRKGTIRLSDMQNLGGFIKGLQHDKNLLTDLHKALLDFADKYARGQERDPKLDHLEQLLCDKQGQGNKKVVLFTTYTDTALFLFDELRRRGFTHMACVTGTLNRTTGHHPTAPFTPILQSVAPYSKLYKEKDWGDLYLQARLDPQQDYDPIARRWHVPYDRWQQLIRRHRPDIARQLDDPIDILIATDCLSEGQNLQDADLQVNYDIHWNPVRLIQRFGRIDRLGSPNQRIQCVNFWPAASFNDYLNLQRRIETRMAAMKVVGAETVQLTDSYQQMIADNPLLAKSEERLLRQFAENSISDIEQLSPQSGGDGGGLSLSDLSLETFRQDLIDYFDRHKEEFLRMPPGVFSGFQVQDTLFERYSECLVAVVGHPRRQPGTDTPYQQVLLMCQPVNADPTFTELNRAEVLTLLRDHKLAPRCVPAWIDRPADDRSAAERLARLSAMTQAWMRMKMPRQQQDDVLNLFSGMPAKQPPLSDARYDITNYDLIAWEYITKVE